MLKQKINSIALFLLFISLSLCISCTSLENVAYKTTGSVVVSVDGAMRVWGDYVRSGSATVNDQLRVRDVYEKYQSAIKVERSILVAYKTTPDDTALNAAMSALSNASGELVTLVQSLVNVKVK